VGSGCAFLDPGSLCFDLCRYFGGLFGPTMQVDAWLRPMRPFRPKPLGLLALMLVYGLCGIRNDIALGMFISSCLDDLKMDQFFLRLLQGFLFRTITIKQ